MTGYKDLYLDICASNKECTQAIKQFEKVFEQNRNSAITIYIGKVASIFIINH